MSDKQNFAKTIFDAWQQGVSGMVKDKQFTDLMVDNYAKFQDFLKASAQNPDGANTCSGDTRAKNDELSFLRAKLEMLETRVSQLESRASDGNSNIKPK